MPRANAFEPRVKGSNCASGLSGIRCHDRIAHHNSSNIRLHDHVDRLSAWRVLQGIVDQIGNQPVEVSLAHIDGSVHLCELKPQPAGGDGIAPQVVRYAADQFDYVSHSCARGCGGGELFVMPRASAAAALGSPGILLYAVFGAPLVGPTLAGVVASKRTDHSTGLRSLFAGLTLNSQALATWRRRNHADDGGKAARIGVGENHD
jgi:hypothetical protein